MTRATSDVGGARSSSTQTALAQFIAGARVGLGPFAVDPSRHARTRGREEGFDPSVDPATPTDPRVEALLANPTVGNVATPALLKGVQAKASDLNLYTLASNVWVPVVIDRPEIWIPQGFIEAPIWYSPNLIPKVASSVGDLQKSTKFGVVYLSSPGTWWLQYTVSPAATVTMLRIDAFQPGVVSRYLGEAGNHNAINTVAATTLLAPNVVLLNDGTVATVLAANRDRTGVTLQNNSVQGGGGTNGVILITHSSNLGIAGKNPIASGNTGGPRGTALQVGASITYTGDTNVKGNIRACAQATTAMMANLQLDIIEYT